MRKFPAKNITAEKIKAWAVLTLCSVIVYVNICTANVAYHKLQMAYEKSYGILMRISDRIESLDGYEKAKNILVVGWLENSESYSVNFPPEIVGTTDGLINPPRRRGGGAERTDLRLLTITATFPLEFPVG